MVEMTSRGGHALSPTVRVTAAAMQAWSYRAFTGEMFSLATESDLADLLGVRLKVARDRRNEVMHAYGFCQGLYGWRIDPCPKRFGKISTESPVWKLPTTAILTCAAWHCLDYFGGGTGSVRASAREYADVAGITQSQVKTAFTRLLDAGILFSSEKKTPPPPAPGIIRVKTIDPVLTVPMFLKRFGNAGDEFLIESDPMFQQFAENWGASDLAFWSDVADGEWFDLDDLFHARLSRIDANGSFRIVCELAIQGENRQLISA